MTYYQPNAHVWNFWRMVARQMMVGLCNPVYLYVNRRCVFATRAMIYTDLHRSTLSYITRAALANDHSPEFTPLSTPICTTFVCMRLSVCACACVCAYICVCA